MLRLDIEMEVRIRLSDINDQAANPTATMTWGNVRMIRLILANCLGRFLHACSQISSVTALAAA